MSWSIGDALGSLFGGKNEYDPNQDRHKVDDNAYNYGGRPNGAADAAASAERTSNDYNAQARYATDQAYGDRNNAAGARAEQGNAMAMMKARASGAVPSVAQLQGQRDMEAARAAQSSAAASARGPGGLALAQQNAAANTAAAQQGISGQSQVNAMNERERAESAYMGAATGMRQQDYAGAQQAAGMSGQFQNTAQGYAGLQNNIQQSQLNAGMNRESQKSANANAVMGIKAGIAGQNAGSAQTYGMGSVNMGSSVAGGIAGMPGKAAGGPVAAGQPYVMGEEGPELVIPGAGAGSGGPMGSPTGTTVIGKGGGMDVMGSLKANSKFATQFVGNPIAREKGGPVPPGKPVLVGEKGPEIVVPTQPGHVLTAEQTKAVLSPGDLVASTWGSGPPAEDAQRVAHADASERLDNARGAIAQSQQWKNGYQHDVDHAAAMRRVGIDPDEEEVRKEKVGRSMGKYLKANAGNPPPAEKDEAPAEKPAPAAQAQAAAPAPAKKKLSMGELVASGIEKGSARMLDGGASGYRPMSTYQAPQLLSAGIPLSGTREGGGPVDAGKAYLVGEKGPEMMKPAAAPAKQSPEDLKKWAEGELSRVQGAKVAPSNDERWARDEIERLQASQSVAPAVGDSERWARDEIDRLNASKDAPAAVRRLESGSKDNGYTTELTPEAEKGFQAWRERTAPWDTGEDYDLRGAYADGLDRDARQHLPDTYKKPNHETFSNESKYAKDAPAVAGSWDGERYSPGPGAWAQSEIDRLKAAKAAAPAVQPRPEEEEQRFMLSQILRGRR